MNEQMEFPETFEKFAEEYGFKDTKEIYTNGSDLIQVFRVKQWLEHDNKLRTIETDTAYECGKHANRWIPCNERLPENDDNVLVYDNVDFFVAWYGGINQSWHSTDKNFDEHTPIIAWMPLPEPYKTEREK